MITPTTAEKAEWSRMAQAAYAAGRNDIGHRYSVAASLPALCRIATREFDELHGDYRAWLIDGTWPDFRAIAYDFDTREPITERVYLRVMLPEPEEYEIVADAFRAGQQSYTIGGGAAAAVMIVRA